MVNNIKIATAIQSYTIGNNNAIISGIHQDIVNDKLKISLLVNPKNDNLTIINSVNILTWGNAINDTSIEYNCIQTTENYILSYQSNNRLYIKYIPINNIDIQDDLNFEFYANCKSHSIIFDSQK